jgi:hypothetical protein
VAHLHINEETDQLPDDHLEEGSDAGLALLNARAASGSMSEAA